MFISRKTIKLPHLKSITIEIKIKLATNKSKAKVQ